MTTPLTSPAAPPIDPAPALPRVIGSEDRRVVDTALVLTLAAWLIFNSHLDGMYPRPWMGADGLLGNALFLMLSGYGIQMSLLARRQSFGGFLWRRIVRLYPAVWLCVAFDELLVHHHYRDYAPIDYVHRFIWPTQYTYVEAISIYYLLLYALGRWRRPILGWVAMAIGFLPYLISAAIRVARHDSDTPAPAMTTLEGWSLFWGIVALGMTMAFYDVRSRLTIARVAGVVIVGLTYYAIRFSLIGGHRPAALYRVPEVLLVALVGLLFYTFADPTLVRRIRAWPIVGLFVTFSAACTLEVYTTHSVLIHLEPIARHRFPVNIALLLLATLIATWLLHQVCEWIRRRAERPRSRVMHRHAEQRSDEASGVKS